MTDIFKDFEGFTPEQKNKLEEWSSDLEKRLDDRATDKAKEILEDSGLSQEALSMAPRERTLMTDNRKFNDYLNIWKNNGYAPGVKGQINMGDLFKMDTEYTRKMRDTFSQDHPLLTQRVVTQLARDAIEPNIVLTALLQRLNYSSGTQITFPAWGAMAAADVPEGAEYPERSIELAGQTTATIGKSGLAFKLSAEQIRYNQFDIMAAHMRAAGRAMIRWKEQKVADMLTTDNTNVILSGDGSSGKKVTGRNSAGGYNGTLTLDDIFYAYGDMVNNGFVPDTLIMHPFAWKIFAQEGIARAFGFEHGNPALMWQLPQNAGSSAAGSFRVGGLNQETKAGTTSNSTNATANLARTATNVPSIFPTGFRVVVSPFIPFTDNASGSYNTATTDIIFADSNELGVLVVDEELTTDQWDDPARDILKIKFRERYAVAPINNYNGVGKLTGITIARSIDFADKITLQLGTGDLASGLLTGDNL